MNRHGIAFFAVIGLFVGIHAYTRFVGEDGIRVGDPSSYEGMLRIRENGDWSFVTFQTVQELQENERLRPLGRQKVFDTCVVAKSFKNRLGPIIGQSGSDQIGRAVWVRMTAERYWAASTCIQQLHPSGRPATQIDSQLRIISLEEARPIPCGPLTFMLNRRTCPTTPKIEPARIDEPGSYPAEALKAGAEGVSIIELIVGPENQVLKCDLIQSSGNNDLDAAACSTAAQRPEFLNGGSSEGLASGVRRLSRRIRWELSD